MKFLEIEGHRVNADKVFSVNKIEEKNGEFRFDIVFTRGSNHTVKRKSKEKIAMAYADLLNWLADGSGVFLIEKWNDLHNT